MIKFKKVYLSNRGLMTVAFNVKLSMEALNAINNSTLEIFIAEDYKFDSSYRIEALTFE